MPEAQRNEDELAAALSIEDETLRVNTLLALAPGLPEPLLDQAFNAAAVIKDESIRGFALAGFAPYLEKEQLETAVAVASRIGLDVARNQAWGALGPHLPERLRIDVIHLIEMDVDPIARLKG